MKLAGLKPGDIIVAVRGQSFDSGSEFLELLNTQKIVAIQYFRPCEMQEDCSKEYEDIYKKAAAELIVYSIELQAVTLAWWLYRQRLPVPLKHYRSVKYSMTGIKSPWVLRDAVDIRSEQALKWRHTVLDFIGEDPESFPTSLSTDEV